MGHLNADTDHAAMHSYFEKFGAVERCYKIPEKETYKNQGYGFPDGGHGGGGTEK